MIKRVFGLLALTLIVLIFFGIVTFIPGQLGSHEVRTAIAYPIIITNIVLFYMIVLFFRKPLMRLIRFVFEF